MDEQLQRAKRARFARLAESRTEAVLQRIRILGNCANPQVYDWTEDDLRQIFSAMRRELERVELRFQEKFRSRATFHLDASPLHELAQWSAVPLKPADRSWGMGHSLEQKVLESRAVPSLRHERPASASKPVTAVDASDVQRLPVPGHERSQVEVRLDSAPGWYVRAKDKGHRLGYVLHLFGPDANEHRRCDTGRGTKRGEAVRMAAQMLADAIQSEGGVQLAFTAV